MKHIETQQLDPRVSKAKPSNDNGVTVAPDAVTEEQLDRLAVELGRYIAEVEFRRQQQE